MQHIYYYNQAPLPHYGYPARWRVPSNTGLNPLQEQHPANGVQQVREALPLPSKELKQPTEPTQAKPPQQPPTVAQDKENDSDARIIAFLQNKIGVNMAVSKLVTGNLEAEKPATSSHEERYRPSGLDREWMQCAEEAQSVLIDNTPFQAIEADQALGEVPEFHGRQTICAPDRNAMKYRKSDCMLSSQEEPSVITEDSFLPKMKDISIGYQAMIEESKREIRRWKRKFETSQKKCANLTENHHNQAIAVIVSYFLLAVEFERLNQQAPVNTACPEQATCHTSVEDSTWFREKELIYKDQIEQLFTKQETLYAQIAELKGIIAKQQEKAIVATPESAL